MDTGLQHDIEPRTLHRAYERREASGEGWHFDQRSNGLPARTDLSNAAYDVYYRDEDESFIVVRDGWAVEIAANDPEGAA